MSFFDLDPQASQNLLNRARSNPVNPNDLAPAWYAGAWKAPVTGLASAVNDAALLTGQAFDPLARVVTRPIDKLFGTKLEEFWDGERQKTIDAIKNWSPDPRTTGVVGQVTHSLVNVIPEAMAGGPGLAAVLQGNKSIVSGLQDGLDPGTAFTKGAIDAFTTWAGMKLPMQFSPTSGAAMNIGTAAAINVPFGMASRGATGELLKARGYNEMAEQYQVMDRTAIITDLIMGGAFGAMAHYGPGIGAKVEAWRKGEGPKIQPSDVDTALLLNSQHHMEIDTAPGVPTDVQTRAAHVEEVNRSIEALMRDETPIVRPGVTDGNFIENPGKAEFQTMVRAAVEEHLGPEWKVLESELQKRGLPIDEIDKSGGSGVFRPRQAESARPAGETTSRPGEAGQQQAGEPVKAGTEPKVTDLGDNRPVEVGRVQGDDIAATQQVHQVLAEKPDLAIHLDDGEVMARDALARADEEIATARQDEPGFDAAVACLLRG
jgi:hypothetical protein